jgi:hypothetical protein
MRSDSPEVRRVLTTIADKISKSTAVLDTKEMNNALYNLRNLGKDCPEVRHVMSVLANKLLVPRKDTIAIK